MKEGPNVGKDDSTISTILYQLKETKSTLKTLYASNLFVAQLLYSFQRPKLLSLNSYLSLLSHTPSKCS